MAESVFSQTFHHFYSFVPSVFGRMSGPTESISSVQRWPSFLLTFDRAGRLFGEFNLTILPLKCQGLERLKAAAQRFGAESKKVQAGYGWLDGPGMVARKTLREGGIGQLHTKLAQDLGEFREQS